MPKNRILEEQKFTFIKNHLKNRVDEDTLIRIQEQAKMQYLSVSAYIRKCLDLQLDKEGCSNESQRVS